MNKLCHYLDLLGLVWFVPLVRFAAGEDRPYQARTFLRMVVPPVLAILLSLGAWHLLAVTVKLGEMSLPTPAEVGKRGIEMVDEWRAERKAAADFETGIIAKAAATGKPVSELRQVMRYESKKTFTSQVWLSLKTAFAGVFLGVIIAVPIGILCGLSGTAFAMANPLIQVFKPVSPLAWFPVVYIIINKLMENMPNDGAISKSFLIAMLVVTLCSLWPSLINTANGVANVEKDHLNVARVLNLGLFTRIWRIILPSSLPHIFTGVRLSMGIGWMVLIAAEMMAVSPGLGGFIWDWYQSSNDVALSYLLLAVVVIGGIGFLIDRTMIALQRLVSHGSTATIR